jgi:MscS family membrane protein
MTPIQQVITLVAVVMRVVVGLAFLIIAPAASLAAVDVADTPRAAINGFLTAASAGDWVAASHFLDLRRIAPTERERTGAELARQLYAVLDRSTTVDPESLSDQPDGDRSDGLPATQERVATVDTKDGPVSLLLQRGVGPNAGWRVAPATVARIPGLHADLGGASFEGWLPEPLVRVRVLKLPLWQWIALLLLLVLAWAASWFATLVAVRALRAIVRRTRSPVAEELLTSTVGPLRLGLGVIAFAAGGVTLDLPLAARQVLGVIERGAAIVAIAWVLLRFVDVLAGMVAQRLAARGGVTATAVVPIGGRSAKIAVVTFAGIAILQNLGLDVTGVLAGLGIGGLAVALAAQKTVENLFGGVSLIVDQPLRPGDFCRFGDRVGTVEEIGLRSTRIRTLDRTVVSVPNAQFSAQPLENFATRDRMWFHPILGLRYETTPDQVRYVLVEIRRMLYAHPRVDPDPARIRFVGFGAHSLDLEVFAYVLTADYGEFLAIQEDLNLRIMDIVAASGTGFAFPSQTTYLASDRSVDPERQTAAEQQVRAWRAAGGLPLPEFTPDAIAAVRGTLAYPDRGRRPPTESAA